MRKFLSSKTNLSRQYIKTAQSATTKKEKKIVHVHAYSDQNNLQLHIEQQIDKMPSISFLFCDLLLLFKP